MTRCSGITGNEDGNEQSLETMNTRYDKHTLQQNKHYKQTINTTNKERALLPLVVNSN